MRLLVSLFILLLSFQSQAILRVTVDPGHGGDEEGAVHGGVKEKNLALQISKKLVKKLEKDKRFQVQILRTKDNNLELEDRVKKSEAFQTDLFVSIHANASPSPKLHGIEFYIQNQLPVDEETLFLAHQEHSGEADKEDKPRGDVESIIFDLEKSHKILTSYQVGGYLRKKWSNHKKYRIRQGPFYVLSQNKIPAVLVEVGYLTNSRERKKLTQKDYQNQVVKKIHLGLVDYQKNMDKLTSGILKTQNAKTR